MPPKPAVSAVAPVAARTWRRVSPSRLIVMLRSPWRLFCKSLVTNPGYQPRSPTQVTNPGHQPRSSTQVASLLLQSEFADCSRNVIQRLCDDLPQFRGRRGLRQRAALFDQLAVVRRRHDRHDMAVELTDDGRRRPLARAD